MLVLSLVMIVWVLTAIVSPSLTFLYMSTNRPVLSFAYPSEVAVVSRGFVMGGGEGKEGKIVKRDLPHRASRRPLRLFEYFDLLDLPIELAIFFSYQLVGER